MSSEQAAWLFPEGSTPCASLSSRVAPGMAEAPPSICPSVRPSAGRDVGHSELPMARHGPKSPWTCCPCKPCCLLGMGGSSWPLGSGSPVPRTCNRRGRKNGGMGHQKPPISPQERARIWLKTHPPHAEAAAAQTDDQQPWAGADNAPVPVGSGPDPNTACQPRGPCTSTHGDPPALPLGHRDPSFPSRARRGPLPGDGIWPPRPSAAPPAGRGQSQSAPSTKPLPELWPGLAPLCPLGPSTPLPGPGR